MPLEDYIIAVFCLIDDLYKLEFTSNAVRKAGFAPTLHDAEIISMLTVGECLGLTETKQIWLEFKSSYAYLFPAIKSVEYKVFNKQATNLWHVIQIIHKKLIATMGTWDLVLADGFPLPICHYARAGRCKSFKDKVAFGYCAAKNEKYYGFKVLLVTTQTGIPIDYVVGAANIDERDMLLNADLPSGCKVIGDKGFIGQDFAQKLIFHSDATMITQTRSNMIKQHAKETNSLIRKIRKRIETSISQLIGQFNVTVNKARSYHGFIGRLSRKMLSYTTALYFNYQIVKDQFTQLELLITP